MNYIKSLNYFLNNQKGGEKPNTIIDDNHETISDTKNKLIIIFKI